MIRPTIVIIASKPVYVSSGCLNAFASIEFCIDLSHIFIIIKTDHHETGMRRNDLSCQRPCIVR